jgi:hypothetical protein
VEFDIVQVDPIRSWQHNAFGSLNKGRIGIGGTLTHDDGVFDRHGPGVFGSDHIDTALISIRHINVLEGDITRFFNLDTNTYFPSPEIGVYRLH